MNLDDRIFVCENASNFHGSYSADHIILGLYKILVLHVCLQPTNQNFLISLIKFVYKLPHESNELRPKSGRSENWEDT